MCSFTFLHCFTKTVFCCTTSCVAPHECGLSLQMCQRDSKQTHQVPTMSMCHDSAWVIWKSIRKDETARWLLMSSHSNRQEGQIPFYNTTKPILKNSFSHQQENTTELWLCYVELLLVETRSRRNRQWHQTTRNHIKGHSAANTT